VHFYIGSNVTTKLIKSWTKTHVATRTTREPCLQCGLRITFGDQYVRYVYSTSHPRQGRGFEVQYLHEIPECPIYRDDR